MDGLNRLSMESIGSPLAVRVDFHEEIGSTQQRARELARENAPHGTLVISRVQRSGRGRLGRNWGSPPGGLWMSVVLRLDLAPHLTPRVTPAAAVGVAKALRGFGVEARIKWPNDLLVKERKVCGILAESGGRDPDRFVVLGIGINANVDPQDLGASSGHATTLRSELGRDVDLLELLGAVLRNLDFEIGRLRDFGAIMDDWRALDCTLGRRVRVRRFGEAVEGKALDLGPEGQLIIQTDSGPVEVFEGDVEHLRQEGL
ncbi:biotin--[acetyl-CoA-carboxylase] ligase [soil metagenome]|nr:biotin--[acetyl-CoA-carboxylase] ligase [Rubrobacter sp.]